MRIPGHAIPWCASLRVRCWLDLWPLAFSLRDLRVEVGFPAALPVCIANCYMLRLPCRKPYTASSAELCEYREPISKHPVNVGRTGSYLVASDSGSKEPAIGGWNIK